jgi:long-chain-fatty-acid--CoA ligase ACSBG
MTVRRDGELQNWSYNEYLRDITSVAKAFLLLGLEGHNGVAIWGFNSPEWFIADIAAIFAGGVVSRSFHCHQAKSLFLHCQCVLLERILDFRRTLFHI